jgi:gliding motility-associated protein GldL
LGADDGQSFGKQLSEVSQKLSSLNAVYELQLQGSNDFLKSQSKLHSGITELMENLNASVSDTKKFKEEVGALAENLSALNTVYGNMLTAMGGKK